MASVMTEQALNTKDLIELENRYGAHNYHPLDVVIERAEGVWVFDVEVTREEIAWALDRIRKVLI
jgi:ornithine--oxo-acid transaminase